MILNLESSGFSFTVEPNDAPSTMGREEPADIVVESSSVSRKHCELTYEDGDWLVKDLGSRYGTTVNGKVATKPTKLGNGDVLKLGSQNFIVSLLATNDMKDLGRQLSGGKVRMIVGQAMQKRPEAPKVPPARKKKIEPSRATVMLEKDEESAEGESAPASTEGAPAEAEASAKSTDDADAPAENDAESAAAEQDEAKPAKGIKASKKGSMRSRGAPVTKKSSPLALVLKLVILAAALGAAGYFGWTQYQAQQANAANPADGSAQLKLPPKPGTVALPAKEDKKDDVVPIAKPNEKPLAKPDEKAPDPKPEEKTEAPKESKPDEKAEPKKDDK